MALVYFLPGQGALAHAQETDAGGTREEAKVIELGNTYSETTDTAVFVVPFGSDSHDGAAVCMTVKS